jgi:hypothetical protein
MAKRRGRPLGIGIDLIGAPFKTVGTAGMNRFGIGSFERHMVRLHDPL